MQEEYLGLTEASDYLGITGTKLSKLAKDNKIRTVVDARTHYRRFAKADLDRLLLEMIGQLSQNHLRGCDCFEDGGKKILEMGFKNFIDSAKKEKAIDKKLLSVTSDLNKE